MTNSRIMSLFFLNLTLFLSVGVANGNTAALTKVKTNEVCMVNDQHFQQEQIPVQVQGKTYYGCCEGCKKTLSEKAEARMAKDPVSGRAVDKATAVIGADSSKNVFYFENEKNLDAYNAKVTGAPAKAPISK